MEKSFGAKSGGNFGGKSEGKPQTITSPKGWCFSVQLLPEQIVKLNHIKEAHTVQAQSQQERMMFFYAATSRKKYVVYSNLKLNKFKKTLQELQKAAP